MTVEGPLLLKLQLNFGITGLEWKNRVHIFIYELLLEICKCKFLSQYILMSFKHTLKKTLNNTSN